MEPPHGFHRVAASASGVVAALTTVIYVAVMVKEGNNSFWAVFPWVVIMLIGTFAALGSALAPGPRVGQSCVIAAIIIFGILGLVAIFSFGIGCLVAAVLACLAAVSYSSSEQTSYRESRDHPPALQPIDSCVSCRVRNRS
jgi:hypothetical protein